MKKLSPQKLITFASRNYIKGNFKKSVAKFEKFLVDTYCMVENEAYYLACETMVMLKKSLERIDKKREDD